MTRPDAPHLTLSVGDGAACAVIVADDLLTFTSLCRGDTELLDGAADLPPGYRVHDRRAGITFLHPWANRLGADQYTFGGVSAQIDGTAQGRVTRDASGLAIHGIAAEPPWHLVQSAPESALASLDWTGHPGFPFPHRVEVTFTLGASDGAVTLNVASRVEASDGPVPISFGWHPYFIRTDPAEIMLPPRSELLADADGLPTGARVPHASSRTELSDERLDYGIADLDPGAEMTLEVPGHAVTVSLDSGYPYGQIFAPPDRPVVSLEPMTAPTDALCAPGAPAVAVAEPGRPFSAEFTVWVS